MKKLTYTDPSGKTRQWEMAERQVCAKVHLHYHHSYTNHHQTRPKNTECDGVGVIAILRDPEKGPSLLLQKQFRPPLNRVTIEVPSGLIDEGETITQSALRELKEETGYVATMSEGEREDGGFIMWNDPGFCVSFRRWLLPLLLFRWARNVSQCTSERLR